MSSHRIAPQPGEVIDRGTHLDFTWDGDPHRGLGGDTIASALAASGVRLMSRSFKYHRRRGLLTASYHDPNAIVQVGDDPNVRAAHRKLTQGMEVQPQNAWPSLETDAKAANQLISRFLPPGFYYKTFMSPRPLWPVYQRVLGRFAAGGQVSPAVPEERYDHRHAHPDVVVAGGGPAGMAAALGAAEAGASVILVEEEHDLGGHLRWGGEADLEALHDLASRVARTGTIEVLTDSVVAGRYDHNWVSIVERRPGGERLIKARAKALVVATGKVERPYVFAGNDLPGVMLSTAVLRLVSLYAVRPGDRAVVLTANSSGDQAIAALARAGVELAAVLDARNGEGIEAALGRKQVREVVDSRGRHIGADLLVTAAGWTTATPLLDMAGVRSAYVPEAARFIPGDLPEGVFAAGSVVGDGSAPVLVEHGEAVGRQAAAHAARLAARWLRAAPAGSPDADITGTAIAVEPLSPEPHPELFLASTHGFVDFSEDVTSKDMAVAAAEGYDSIELAKRYTTATMGPLQGKIESVNALAAHSEAMGGGLLEKSTTTWRPPWAPIRLGTLAGRRYEPVRYSTIQPWHERHGARPLVAGQWIRPEHYGDPEAEVRSVREGVGIIDVSPLGKIELSGPDVAALLEFAYVNKWSKLDVGKVRYGVMCAEDGVVLDDGVTGRLGEDRYMMTTTSGGAGTVWNWLDDWAQTGGRGWDVRMTAVTDGYASINVAGPRSRELMGRVTDIDLRPESFGYMEVRTGKVAGVENCFVWRIGFTGELSYEIHAPSAFGLWVWEKLLSKGEDLGVTPFGVEAQRIMRLEKGHFIVGQDTDGLTQAHGIGVDWAVRLDKEDFAGRPELMWQKGRGGYPRLVAIQTNDPEVVPPEASQIVDAGDNIVGRVTSSRWSPTLGRSICLAQVQPGFARPGARVLVRLPSGTKATARVLDQHAHFDPEGARLHG